MTILLLITLPASAVERIQGSGASFPAPLYDYWAFQYAKATHGKVDYLNRDYSYSNAPHTRVKYHSIGSGGGVKAISARNVDFGASDEPLKGKALSEMNLIQFPAVIGSILIVYNIDGIGDTKLKLTNEVVADIFAGRITRWNDPRITGENPHVKLPDALINVVHRDDSSGTTFNFTYFLSQSSPYWKEHFGSAKVIDWATGFGANGNDGVAFRVRSTTNAIGYAEKAYQRKYGLSAAVLQTANGHWVEASDANIKAAAKFAKWSEENYFHQLLCLQPGDTSYPIVAATFILLPKEKPAMNKKVIDFFKHAFENGDDGASRLGYVPLPDSTKKLILDYLQKSTDPHLSSK